MASETWHPFVFRFRVEYPISDDLAYIMRDEGERMMRFQGVVIDQDRMGGQVTFAFDPHKISDLYTQQVCEDWVNAVRAGLHRKSTAAVIKNEERSAVLTADSASVLLPFFEPGQFHVIKDFISTENPTDQLDLTFAGSIDEYIDYVRNQVAAGEDPETALELADEVAQPLTERHADLLSHLGAVAATAAEIAMLTSTLGKQVAAARQVGASWRQIARAAGVDVAVAHRRWRKGSSAKPTDGRGEEPPNGDLRVTE
jgi:hypothetical protein